MEWAVVAVIGVILLLFGSKKLPDMARGLGQSVRIFQDETRSLRGDERPAVADRPDGERGAGERGTGEAGAPGRAAGDGTSSGPRPGDSTSS